MKAIRGQRGLQHRGATLVSWVFAFYVAAYNLLRMRALLEDPRRREMPGETDRDDEAGGRERAPRRARSREP
jgi:hypothetical protein